MKIVYRKFLFFILILLIIFSFSALLSCQNVHDEIDIQYDAGQQPKIVFSSEISGNWELYIMDIDGKNITRLTDSEVSDYHARFSPDGESIVFVSRSENDKDKEIFVMNSDGTNMVKLTDNESNEDDPCFTPDGKKIVFVSDRDTEINNSPYPITSIYIMNVDGTDEIKLKDDPYGNYGDYDPCISPDGDYMVFSSSRTFSDEIYLMDLSNMSTVNLTNNEDWDGRPRYSPDGKEIVFVSDRENKSAYMDIYIMDITGKKVVRLTDSGSWDSRDPCFSPDGKWIVFSSDEDGDSDIYLMDINGKGLANLTDNDVDDYYPSFSPR